MKFTSAFNTLALSVAVVTGSADVVTTAVTVRYAIPPRQFPVEPEDLRPTRLLKLSLSPYRPRPLSINVNWASGGEVCFKYEQRVAVRGKTKTLFTTVLCTICRFSCSFVHPTVRNKQIDTIF